MGLLRSRAPSPKCTSTGEAASPREAAWRRLAEPAASPCRKATAPRWWTWLPWPTGLPPLPLPSTTALCLLPLLLALHPPLSQPLLLPEAQQGYRVCAQPTLLGVADGKINQNNLKVCCSMVTSCSCQTSGLLMSHTCRSGSGAQPQ